MEPLKIEVEISDKPDFAAMQVFAEALKMLDEIDDTKAQEAARAWMKEWLGVHFN